jgi:capsular polysaccharide biosynthesis protein
VENEMTFRLNDGTIVHGMPLSFYREGSRPIGELAPPDSCVLTSPIEPGAQLDLIERGYPAIQARSFENVEAVALSSALLRRKTVYIPDYCKEHEQVILHDPYFLKVHLPERQALMLRGPRARAWNGIMLFQLGAFNWYHWLIEILPMAYLAGRLPDQYAVYPFVIPKQLAQIKNFRDSLELFLGGRKAITIDQLGLTFKELIVIDPIAKGPHNLRPGVWPTRDQYSYNQNLLMEYRDAILDRLNIQQNGQINLIFFTRENDRREFNQIEIENIAIRHGFRLVYMEKLSFREQVELMFGAKVIVGASGAAFSNILFCQKGARVLSWLLPQYKGFSSFSNLAQAVGADMRYIFSEPRQPIQNTQDAYGAKYHLDPLVFEDALKLAVHPEDY